MKPGNMRELDRRPAATVNLVGGRLCLDFVNSVGARRSGPAGRMVIRDEKLNDFIDVIAWARHAGAFNDATVATLHQRARRARRAAARAFRDLIELREALYRVFHSIRVGRRAQRGDLAVLNRAVQSARGVRQIVMGRNPSEWRWSEAEASFDTLKRFVAESAVEFLTEADLSRLSRCGGDDCGWLFEDVSRNHSREWCDTRDCGNRARVRRFRDKRK